MLIKKELNQIREKLKGWYNFQCLHLSLMFVLFLGSLNIIRTMWKGKPLMAIPLLNWQRATIASNKNEQKSTKNLEVMIGHLGPSSQDKVADAIASEEMWHLAMSQSKIESLSASIKSQKTSRRKTIKHRVPCNLQP